MTYVTIKKAAEVTGLTEKAIRKRIEVGKWLEGREYRRAPGERRIFINLQGVSLWLEGSRSEPDRSESFSVSMA